MNQPYYYVDRNAENLKLLSVFHYVLGGLGLLIGLFPLLYVFMGLLFRHLPMQGHGAPENMEQVQGVMSMLFIVMGFVGFFIAEGMAVCMIMAGRFLGQRRRHTFVLVVAAVECLFLPFGTILGVFTLINLTKPEVKAMFGLSGPEPGQGPAV